MWISLAPSFKAPENKIPNISVVGIASILSCSFKSLPRPSSNSCKSFPESVSLIVSTESIK